MRLLIKESFRNYSDFSTFFSPTTACKSNYYTFACLSILVIGKAVVWKRKLNDVLRSITLNITLGREKKISVWHEKVLLSVLYDFLRQYRASGGERTRNNGMMSYWIILDGVHNDNERTVQCYFYYWSKNASLFYEGQVACDLIYLPLFFLFFFMFRC